MIFDSWAEFFAAGWSHTETKRKSHKWLDYNKSLVEILIKILNDSCGLTPFRDDSF